MWEYRVVGSEWKYAELIAMLQDCFVEYKTVGWPWNTKDTTYVVCVEE